MILLLKRVVFLREDVTIALNIQRWIEVNEISVNVVIVVDDVFVVVVVVIIVVFVDVEQVNRFNR